MGWHENDQQNNKEDISNTSTYIPTCQYEF